MTEQYILAAVVRTSCAKQDLGFMVNVLMDILTKANTHQQLLMSELELVKVLDNT